MVAPTVGPATQLQADELIPPGYGGGPSGGGSATGSRVGTLGGRQPHRFGRRPAHWVSADRPMMLGSITRSFRPPTITRCSILSRRTRMTLRFPSTGGDSITATRVGATTLPWSHRLCTDSNAPDKFALRSFARGPKRTSA